MVAAGSLLATDTTAHAAPARKGCNEAGRRLIQGAFEDWRTGERPITDVFAPDIVWRIEGRSAIAKVYESRQQFIDEVSEPFAARFDRSRTPFRPTSIHHVFCDGDTSIVYWSGRGITNNGRPYVNSYVWIMKVRGGKVTKGVAFYDSISFDELWYRVKPNTTPAREGTRHVRHRH